MKVIAAMKAAQKHGVNDEEFSKVVDEQMTLVALAPDITQPVLPAFASFAGGGGRMRLLSRVFRCRGVVGASARAVGASCR